MYMYSIVGGVCLISGFIVGILREKTLGERCLREMRILRHLIPDVYGRRRAQALYEYLEFTYGEKGNR